MKCVVTFLPETAGEVTHPLAGQWELRQLEPAHYTRSPTPEAAGPPELTLVEGYQGDL